MHRMAALAQREEIPQRLLQHQRAGKEASAHV